MDQNQQKTALKRYGFDSSDPLLEWLNAALHDIESYEDWTFLEDRLTYTLVVGDSVVTFADLKVASGKNVFKVQSMWNTVTGLKLQERERTRFDREVSNPDASGPPCLYVMTGPDTIQFYPVPDESTDINISFLKYFDDMIDGITTSPLPTRFHYLQVIRAAAFGLAAESEEDRAQAALTQFETSMSRMSARYDDRTDDEPQSVVDSMGYSNS